ncbi:MAG: hypothetical protein WAN48_01295 [Actinomycetes bacterium]
MDPARSPRSSGAARDSGSIVLGWLTRVTVTLGLLAIVGFEVLSIAVTNVSLQDVGATAADDALSDFQQHHDPVAAYNAAAAYAESQGATIPKKTFMLNVDGSVNFDVRKTAPTLVLFRIKPLAHYAEIVVPINAEPIGSTGSLP